MPFVSSRGASRVPLPSCACVPGPRRARPAAPAAAAACGARASLRRPPAAEAQIEVAQQARLGGIVLVFAPTAAREHPQGRRPRVLALRTRLRRLLDAAHPPEQGAQRRLPRREGILEGARTPFGVLEQTRQIGPERLDRRLGGLPLRARTAEQPGERT